VANKPVLFRVIESIRDAGITEIGIVVGDTAAEIRKAVGNGDHFGVNVTYIEQEAPLGLAHAVRISGEFLQDDSFVMYLGDNVIQGGISELVSDFATNEWNSQIVLTSVKHPEEYGVAELKEDGSILRMVEKPKSPQSDLALVGIYLFDSNIIEAVNSIEPSWRGELEITDAIQWLVDHGLLVHPYIHEGWWIDTGAPHDMLAANDLILEEISYGIDGYVDRGSTIGRRVKVEKGAEIINSVIRGPSIIGKKSRIVNSYIGPFTSIYHHVTIENSDIEHSMVLEHSRISNIEARIQDSLIGRYVKIQRSPMKPKSHKLTLGDHSQLGLL
jgi:glucose-1-phosphate thymidylyltransferase